MFALARATTNNTALAAGLVKSVSNCSIVSYSLLYIVSNFYQQLIDDTRWSSFSESQRAVRFQCTMLNNPASLRSLIRH